MFASPRTVLARYPTVDSAARHDRILLVAPHMDDESIGAGGYAVDAIANGAEVSVVFLTAGDCARFSARILHRTLEPSASQFLTVGRLRIDEAREAMSTLGIPNNSVYILGYPDQGLHAMLRDRDAIVRSSSTDADCVPYDEAISPGAPHTFENVLSDMRRVMELVRPTTIIAPVPFDVHPDHSATSEIADLAAESLAETPNRLGYLVHSSRMKSVLWLRDRALLPPARMRSFTWASYPLAPDVQRVKERVLQTYRSQRPYVYFLRNSFVRRNELFFACTTLACDSQPQPSYSPSLAQVASPVPIPVPSFDRNSI